MFALIANGMVAQLDAAQFPVASPLAWVDVSAITPSPQVGWSYAGGVFTAAAAAPGLSLAQQALGVLTASDTTMHRIAEAVSLGLTSWTTADVVAWVTWRRALRAIVNGGTTATALPARPAYPVST